MKNNKGITLIALVITIIVLLILASVGIAMLTGENGILNKAKVAKEKHNEEQAREKIILAVNNLSAQIVPDENRSIVLDDIVRIENEEIEINKNEDGTIIKYTDEKSKEYVVASVDGYSFKIYEDKKVERLETQEVLTVDYKIKYRINKNEASLLITFESTKAIEKIIYPNEENTIQGNGRKEISIDYTVTAEKEYKFKVILEGGKTLEKTIKIEDDEKFYIYYSGYEYSELTGGWGCGYSDGTSSNYGSAKKENDYIQINTTGELFCAYSAYTNWRIDVTSYSKLKVEVYDVTTVGSGWDQLVFYVENNRNIYYSKDLQDGLLDGEYEFDITDITGYNYISIHFGNGASGKIKRIWLE